MYDATMDNQSDDGRSDDGSRFKNFLGGGSPLSRSSSSSDSGSSSSSGQTASEYESQRTSKTPDSLLNSKEVTGYMLACRKIAAGVAGNVKSALGTSSTGGPLWVAYEADPGYTPFATAAATAAKAAGLASYESGGFGDEGVGSYGSAGGMTSHGVSETEGVQAAEGQCAPASSGHTHTHKPKLAHQAHLSNTVCELDPPSQGMLWQRLTGISLDLALGDVSVRLGVVPEPVMTAGLISLGGSIIRARQQGFPPITFDKIYRVGAYHAASIPTPVKGTRPPMKTYTDLRSEMEDVVASGGMGLEPTIAQVIKAFKRLIPPDNMKPDGTAVSSLPGNPRLRQSDKMRYVWRGCARLGINRMKLIFGTRPVAQPLPQHDPHVVLTSNTLYFCLQGRYGVFLSDGDCPMHACLARLAQVFLYAGRVW
ncbi:hypothetical protein DUNSADRAFT_5785 [Dunaliella salina]|uniref:Uncharacterized protein n=1 Tax=Dunaliella salina TaxID=3046 RepID=A0ABQ7GPL2_DUNSA|nr:hypothetical protein DUNSADRAFT_5785 [Dunaliella salina]|eukprot:KAF5836548.1 hypothetical protein DUNSADRAFT_5785 [Dunaliella salina]